MSCITCCSPSVPVSSPPRPDRHRAGTVHPVELPDASFALLAPLGLLLFLLRLYRGFLALLWALSPVPEILCLGHRLADVADAVDALVRPLSVGLAGRSFRAPPGHHPFGRCNGSGWILRLFLAGEAARHVAGDGNTCLLLERCLAVGRDLDLRPFARRAWAL